MTNVLATHEMTIGKSYTVAPGAPEQPDLHVAVKFGKGIPYDIQCRALMAWEKQLRAETGSRVEVFAHARGDDSKLRAMMTPQQRAKL